MLLEVRGHARLIGLAHEACQQRGLPGGAGNDAQHRGMDLRIAVEVVEQRLGEHQVHHLAGHQLMLVVPAGVAPVEVVPGHAAAHQPVGQRLAVGAPEELAVERAHRQIPHRLAQVVQQAGDPGGDPPARLDVVALVGRAIMAEDVAGRGLRGEPGHLQGVLQQTAGAAVVMHLARRQEVHEGGEAPDDRPHQTLEDLLRAAHAVLQALDQVGLPGQDVVHAAGRQPLARPRTAAGSAPRSPGEPAPAVRVGVRQRVV